MKTLSPVRFGTAIGVAGAVFYVACMIFMATAPPVTIIWFSNSLLHGVDVKDIMRDTVPLQQAAVGIVSTFAGGWIFGAVSAVVYNIGMKSPKPDA